MSDQFDPYYVWLGIPPAEQPPDLYRLLGTIRFEDDPNVIENAADQRMLHLRTFQAGKNGAISQRVLNEVSQAKIILLQPDQKAAYDAQLRAADAQLNAIEAPPIVNSNKPPIIQTDSPPKQLAASPAYVRQASTSIRSTRPPKKATAKWLMPVIIVAVALLALTSVAVVAAILVLPALGDSDSDGGDPVETVRVDPRTDKAKLIAGKTDDARNPNSTRIDLIEKGPDYGTLVGGTVEWEKDSINIGSPDKVNSRYVFHQNLPDKFIVRLNVTRHDLLSGLSLGFPCGESRGHIVIDRDVKEDRFSGMELVDGRRSSHPEYQGAHQGIVMPVDQQVELRVQVEPGRVSLVADGRTIHSWEGAASQLSAESWRKVPDEHSTCLSLQSWNTRFTIEQLVIEGDFEPTALSFRENSNSQNLFDALDLSEQTLEGQTQFEDGVLKLVGGKRVAIEIVDSAPSSYELNLNVTRFDGVDELAVGLAVGDKRTHMIIDRKVRNGLRTGLGIARNRSLGYSGYTGGKQGRVLPTGTPVQLRISVGKKIELHADGVLVYSIDASEEMSETRDYRYPASAESGIILACTRSSFKIHSMSIRESETD